MKQMASSAVVYDYAQQGDNSLAVSNGNKSLNDRGPSCNARDPETRT